MTPQQKVLAYLNTQQGGVLAYTKPDNEVGAAYVGFGVTDSLELIVGTGNTTRKYASLIVRPNIAFVMGGQDNTTVQYEGRARELSDPEAATYKQVYSRKNPNARKHESNLGERYFLITPLWLRFTDYNQHPAEIFELHFP